MNGQTFIEFRGNIITFPISEKVLPEEAWLIAYNKTKENIIPLSKMWTCVNKLGCSYDALYMQELSNLTKPTCLTNSSSPR